MTFLKIRFTHMSSCDFRHSIGLFPGYARFFALEKTAYHYWLFLRKVQSSQILIIHRNFNGFNFVLSQQIQVLNYLLRIKTLLVFNHHFYVFRMSLFFVTLLFWNVFSPLLHLIRNVFAFSLSLFELYNFYFWSTCHFCSLCLSIHNTECLFEITKSKSQYESLSSMKHDILPDHRNLVARIRALEKTASMFSPSSFVLRPLRYFGKAIRGDDFSQFSNTVSHAVVHFKALS